MILKREFVNDFGEYLLNDGNKSLNRVGRGKK